MKGWTTGAAALLVSLLLGGLPAAPVATGISALAAQDEATAPTTTVVVRAVAHDAKVIGSGVGGARVTIKDAETGEVLARGRQMGGTGSTERIMRRPHRRGGTVYGTDGAAKFEAELELDRPTVVEIVAEGPLGVPHATRRASRTMLLVPGRDVAGEGVILVLNGFIVELDRPRQEVTPRAGEAIPVRARVTMMCGCPTTPGGLWDADRIDVTARLVRGAEVVRETSMSYAGETSTYGTTITAPAVGDYRLVVLASDADRGNFGRAVRAVRVRAR